MHQTEKNPKAIDLAPSQSFVLFFSLSRYGAQVCVPVGAGGAEHLASVGDALCDHPGQARASALPQNGWKITKISKF